MRIWLAFIYEKGQKHKKVLHRINKAPASTTHNISLQNIHGSYLPYSQLTPSLQLDPQKSLQQDLRSGISILL